MKDSTAAMQVKLQETNNFIWKILLFATSEIALKEVLKCYIGFINYVGSE